MANVFTKILGIVGNVFQIGGPTGPKQINDAGALEIMAADGVTPATVRAGHVASGAELTQLVSLLSLQGRVAPIDVSCTGAGAPAPNANLGKFIFVHTTGGSYTAGDVLYDNGTALVVMPFEAVRHITTSAAVVGTISFIANGLYCQESLRTFVLKGDGGSTNTGHTMEISIAFGHDALTPVSTTTIPAGARVTNVSIEVTEAFDIAKTSTLLVYVDGVANQTIAATADSVLQTVGIYEVPQMTDIIANTEGPVAGTVTLDASATGHGRLIVTYTTPAA